MADLYVYGAGGKTKYFLPLLKQRYNVLGVFDCNTDKHGEEICGVLVQPIFQNNQIPVCICIADVEAALDVLKSSGFSDILFLLGYEQYGYGIVFRYDSDRELADIIFNSVPVEVFFADIWNIANAKWVETSQTFSESNPRVFNLALFPDEGQQGGSMALCKNLRSENNNYGDITNLFSVNTTQIYCPKGYAKTSKSSLKLKIPYSDLGMLCVDLPLYNHITSVWCRFLLAEYLLQKTNDFFSFKNDDIFLLNDVRDVQAFSRLFPGYENVYVGYHEQGSLSSVMNAKSVVKKFYDEVQLSHLRTFKNWIFPSTGTYYGLYDTSSEPMKSAISSVLWHVAYNGFNVRNIDVVGATKLLTLMESQKKENRFLFISATYLYKNKGVERIPLVLKKIKEQFQIDIFWLLIGDGEMNEQVGKNIKTYLSDGEYHWQKDRLVTQESLFSVFSIADFYIMMHFVSVFDLSILQAMAYGCVPILSNVGGNKELCLYDNGVLIDMDSAKGTAETFLPEKYGQFFTDSEKLQQIKKQNIEIINTKFNNKQFIKGYADIFETAR